MKKLILALTLLTATQASASTHNAFLSLNFGMASTSNPDSSASSQPSWGLQLGMEMMDLGFAQLTPTLAYQSTGLDYGWIGSIDEQTFDLQPIFRKVMNTGFYFAPEFGLANLTVSTLNITTEDRNYFTYGILAGYEFNTEGLISFGPELHLNRFSSATTFEYLARLSVNF
jgi:hypothetical protein